ncbi:MAG: GAF domain-containing protein [Rhodocyclaceae bacterium]|nr:GAF domain-containing protein [Rhodocyclaceae bacterium]
MPPSEGHPPALVAAILDALTAHVAILARDGSIVAVNTAWRSFCRQQCGPHCPNRAGHDVGTNYLRACRECTGPEAEDGRAAAEGIAAVLEGRLARFSYEYACPVPGIGRWFVLEATPLEGDHTACLVAHWEITDRRIRENAVRESEAKFRHLFDTMTQGAFVQRADGSLVDINPAGLELLGLTRDEFLGRTCMHPEWRVLREDGTPWPGEEHPSMVALGTGRAVVGQTAAVFNPRRRDFVWLAINAIPRFRPGESKPHEVFVTLHDITGLKAREGDLARQARTQRAIANSSAALLGATREEDFLREACRIVRADCGYAMVWVGMAERDAARRISLAAIDGFDEDLAIIPPVSWADDEAGAAPTPTAVRTGRPVVCDDIAADPRLGPWKALAARLGLRAAAAFPLLDEAGAAFGVLSVYSRQAHPFRPDEIHLLTVLAGNLAVGIRSLRLRRAKAEVDGMLAKLREEVQGILEWQVAGQTVAAIAHQINQPLNAITTFGEAALRLMRDLRPPPDRLEAAVATMAGQAERAGHILRQLLDLFRRNESTYEALAPADLVREAVDLVGQGTLPCHVRVLAPPDLPRIRANRVQVARILVNLLENATEALAGADSTAVIAPIGVSLAREDDAVVFTITDTGPGLDAAVAPRVFDPFFTTKPRGIGMGLTISRALAEAHGGSLALVVPQGRGAAFRLALPVAS